MLIYDLEEFYEKAAQCRRLTREEEKECALRMPDPEARSRLVENYLPMVAGRIRMLSPELQTLYMAHCCVQALEQCVDGFNFQQDREAFVHRLSWALRQAVTKGIAK